MFQFDQVQRLRDHLAKTDFGASQIEKIKPDHRVIPPSRGHHMRGWHPVRPGHGAIAFESRLECRTISALVAFPEMVRVRSQPVTVTYRDTGVALRYTPDLFVRLSSVPEELAELGFGLETYVEVKPFWRALSVQDKLIRQFAALRNAMNLPVALFTELDLPRMRREVSHGH